MEQLITKPPVLIVDGNYFGHRAVHGLNKEGNFKLETTLEMMQFEQALYDQMLGLFTSFNNNFHTLIGNLIFVFDGYSWRKDVKAHKPYYIDSDEKYGYKENRVDDGLGINWDNWRMCLDNFIQRIELFIAVFKTEGAEGDDAILFLTTFFKKNGVMSIVFCTDGDLKQMTDDLVIIYRNTKSKELPDGEIVISKNISNLYFEQISAMDKLMGRGGLHQEDRQFFKDLFSLQINSGGVKSNAIRGMNKGINIPNHKTDAFIKCLIGDKKDNIFPLFRWKQTQKNGVVNKKVTEKMIVDTLANYGIVLTDESLSVLLDDTQDAKDMFTSMLLALREKTKQTGISKEILIHYEHNKRMNILSFENIPVEVYKKFNDKLKENLPLVNRRLDYELLLENNKQRPTDDADIIKSSVDISAPIEEQNQQSQQLDSDVFNILNS